MDLQQLSASYFKNILRKAFLCLAAATFQPFSAAAVCAVGSLRCYLNENLHPTK